MPRSDRPWVRHWPRPRAETSGRPSTPSSPPCGPGYRSVLEDVLGLEGLVRAEQDAAFFFANEVPAFGRWGPGDLTRVTVPVLLVQGGASPGPTHRLIARLAAALPDARVETIHRANHLLPLTHAADLADIVSSWSRQTTPV